MNEKDHAIANFLNALTALIQACTPAVTKAVNEYITTPGNSRR